MQKALQATKTVVKINLQRGYLHLVTDQLTTVKTCIVLYETINERIMTDIAVIFMVKRRKKIEKKNINNVNWRLPCFVSILFIF